MTLRLCPGRTGRQSAFLVLSEWRAHDVPSRIDAYDLSRNRLQAQEGADHLRDVLVRRLACQGCEGDGALPGPFRQADAKRRRPRGDAVNQDALLSQPPSEGTRHEVHRRLAREVGQVVVVRRLVSGPVADEDEVAARGPLVSL